MIRNSNIDAVKGLGIILVVLGHNWFALRSHDTLFRVIFSFHMPLFFFLSGIFLNENTSMQKTIRSKSASLLKPYFVILILIGAAKYLVASITHGSSFDGITYFTGLLWSTGVTVAWMPMWFLTNLFLGTIFSLLVIKVWMSLRLPKVALLGAILLMLFIGISAIRLFWNPGTNIPDSLRTGMFPGLPWSVDLLPITSSFILLGYLCSDQAKFHRPNLTFFIVAACMFGALHLYFRQTIDLNMRDYGDPFISTLQAVLGIYLIFGLATLLIKFRTLHRMVTYVGTASLFVLIFHFFVQGTVFNKLAAINGVRYGLAAGLSLALGITVPLLLWELTKRQRHLAILLLPVHRPQIATAQAAVT